VAWRRRADEEDEEEDGTGDGHSGERHCAHRKRRTVLCCIGVFGLGWKKGLYPSDEVDPE
jgi:hypothetical protein